MPIPVFFETNNLWSPVIKISMHVKISKKWAKFCHEGCSQILNQSLFYIEK